MLLEVYEATNHMKRQSAKTNLSLGLVEFLRIISLVHSNKEIINPEAEAGWGLETISSIDFVNEIINPETGVGWDIYNQGIIDSLKETMDCEPGSG